EPAIPPDVLVALYRCLIEDTVALARQAGVPRIAVVCPRGDGGDVARWLGIEVVEQDGDGLAAGLDSVFRLFGGDGWRHVIPSRGRVGGRVAPARQAGVPRIAVVCPRGDGGDVARWLDIEVVEQDGDGLAAGLDSVFRLFGGDGCRHVIAFSGDTPHLPPEML